MSAGDAARRMRAELAEVARACGREPADVGLVAVSKTHPVERVREAYAGGQLDLGESYAQELRDKAAALAGEAPDLRWHFIGRLQKNKAKYVAAVAWRVHGLSHVEQAEALGARAPRPLVVLINVNVGREAGKDGVDPGAALALAADVQRVPNVRLAGLMCVPPPADDPEDTAPWFAELAELAARGRANGLPLHELSMGMSHDWRVAVRHGATWIRVGTAIFGARE